MMNTRRAMGWLAAGLTGLGGMLGGCSGTNNNLLETNRTLQDRNTALTQQNESLSNLNQKLQSELAARQAAMAEYERMLAAAKAGNKEWEGRFNEMNARLGSLRFGDLDPTTDSALRQLAAQHPDMLEYDAMKGMLRFKSDLTFASGSDGVSDNGRSTLRQLGTILNGPATLGYEIVIIGHTDSQRISAGTAQRHPTNMHLSAHRAISVRAELVSMGVRADRFMVAGRGEFEPLVPNLPSGNTPQNRRVEIYLARSAGSSEGYQPQAPSGPSATAEDMMK